MESIFDALPPLATTAEVARFLRCSEPQVREYAREGRLAAALVGRSLRFPRASVAAFFAVKDTA